LSPSRSSKAVKKRAPRRSQVDTPPGSKPVQKARAKDPEPAPAGESAAVVPLRRARSTLSRLTIKPRSETAPRPTLELSTKPRPSGPRPLSQVELDEDEVLIDGFDATLDERRVRVTAVLERTCVYIDRNGERRLVRKQDLVVEADKLPIRRRGFA
jgi:hypothetical protein